MGVWKCPRCSTKAAEGPLLGALAMGALVSRADGVVVSRLICIQEVPGSIPVPSTYLLLGFRL